MRLPALGCAEHVEHMRHGHQIHLGAELGQCSLVAEGPVRPEIGHPNTLLEGARRRDDLAENVRNSSVGKRARVVSLELRHQIPFATRHVNRAAASARLDASHLADQRRPLIQRVEDLTVHGIDGGPQASEFAGHPCILGLFRFSFRHFTRIALPAVSCPTPAHRTPTASSAQRYVGRRHKTEFEDSKDGDAQEWETNIQPTQNRLTP